jgi:threonine dehydrogenase-like Zn-dependent dehydrogenase
LIGFPYAKLPFDFESVVAYERAIIGSVGSSKQDFEAALKLLPELDVEALTAHALPLSRYEEAWAAARERKWLKVVLEVGGELDAKKQTASRQKVAA